MGGCVAGHPRGQLVEGGVVVHAGPHLFLGQAASLAGLAPFARDSGTLRGVRTIFGGRAKVRRALFHVGRVGLRHNATLKAFYESLTGRGKPGKVALVACMRKALVILNALLRTGRPWTAEYAAGGPPAEVVSATAS